jgi:gluconate kinase
VRLVNLQDDRVLIGQRHAGRAGHFMPANLLGSQFQTLEEPGPEEGPIIVSVAQRPREMVERIFSSLGLQKRADV